MKNLVFPDQLKEFALSSEFHTYIQKSAKYAHVDKKSEIDVNLLLYTILADENENIITTTLNSMKVDLNILFEMLKENRVNNISDNSKNYITFSDELIKLIQDSYKHVLKLKNVYETSDFFITLLTNKNSISEILFDNAIEYLVFKQTFDEVNEFFVDNFYGEEDIEQDSPKQIQFTIKNNNKPVDKIKQDKEIISKFTTNLNLEYEKGNIGECIGRDDEIETLEKILGRTNKKNALLIGKAGVGKTQIVEGLVRKIINKESAMYLHDKIILSLNINDLEANTTWRGQLEERIRILLNYLNENENTILFIDEIHGIVGSGRAPNADLTNALKPFLTKSKFQIIGATTDEEYKLYIEDKKAFTRRFFLQHIEELNKEETLNILKNVKTKYENFHKVKYPNDILSEIVLFCDKYMKNRCFPDKAIDIMDDLGASVKFARKISKEFISINKQLYDLKITKKYIIENKKYENSEEILLNEKNLKKQLNSLLKKSESDKKTIITKEIFINYLKKSHKISDYYGDDFEVELKDCQTKLKNLIFQQDEIIDSVIDQIRVKRLFNDYSSPLTLFFVGSTGVGKSYLAKLLAENLFQNKNKIISCELYKEKHSVANFIGSPKGYVQSDTGSEIFEYVKYNPECVLTFDEIEKAHPDFYDILLTILDDGLITDKNGDIIDFRRCLLIFTSNIGSDVIKTPQIGFTINKDNKEIYNKSLSKKFKPEFINRIDEIFYFNEFANYEQILENEFIKIKDVMKSKNVDITLTEETKKAILDEIKNNEGSVRLLKRVITKNIKTKIVKQYKQKRALKI